MNVPAETVTGLVRDHAALVLTVLTRAGCPDPEDLAQETFVRAYAALRARPETVPSAPWLVTIALNVRRNELRRLGRRPTASLDREPAAAAQDRDLRLVLAAALDTLPDRHRVPVVLRHVAGLSYEETAAALQRPVGTVKAQVSRGLATLRRYLEENHDDA